MYGHSNFNVVNCRRRWRITMMCLHGTLLALSLILILIMMVSVISRPASIQYFTMVLFLTLISCYSILALIVYCHCRFLLRILSLVTALFLVLIAFMFVMSFLSNVACRFDQTVLHIVNVTKEDCQRSSEQPNVNFSRILTQSASVNQMDGSSDDNHNGSFKCVYRYRYKSPCTPLPHFWDTMGEDDSPGVRAAIKPVAGVYALCVVAVMLATIWHTVDEVRFGRGRCIGCGYLARRVATVCALTVRDDSPSTQNREPPVVNGCRLNDDETVKDDLPSWALQMKESNTFPKLKNRDTSKGIGAKVFYSDQILKINTQLH